MSEVYRFRSTDYLLGEYKELERQTIYFASPEQLNDPMEGFRDIVWRGDSIVWTNLFKNYVYCLNQAYMNFKIAGNDVELTPDHIPIAGRWDEPPTPQFGELVSDIWKEVSEDLSLHDLADAISTFRNDVRRDELIFYLNSIHLRALSRIQEVYIERGLSPEEERPRESFLPGRSTLTENDFFELLQRAEEEHENSSAVMFSIVSQIMIEQQLGYMFHFRTSDSQTASRNRQQLLLRFVNIYVEATRKATLAELVCRLFHE